MIIVRSWSLVFVSPPLWILAIIVCTWSSVIIVTFIIAMTCLTLSSSLHAFGFTVYRPLRASFPTPVPGVTVGCQCLGLPVQLINVPPLMWSISVLSLLSMLGLTSEFFLFC